jgi:hypothetical protein
MACSSKDDISVIRGLIEDCARLAEEHNAKKIIEQTTDTFYANPGKHNRQEVRKVLWWAFRQYKAFKVLYPEPDIELTEAGSTATGRVYFMIVRNKQTYPALKELYADPEAWLEEVGKNADLYRLDLAFIKKDDTWHVSTASLWPFKGLGFDE